MNYQPSSEEEKFLTAERFKYSRLETQDVLKKLRTTNYSDVALLDQIEKEDLPKVHKDLDGFDIKVNSFGEIQMSYDIEKINAFLNTKVEDKKLKHLKDDEKS